MTITHDFKTSLAWSEAQSYEPFWDAVYRKAFPSMVGHLLCTGDTAAQRMGIDRLIHLGSGKTLNVDEKKRSCDYNDILLEYLSNDTTGAIGWIEKDLHIDFLAYAFIPSRRCYLFPWQMLFRAWRHYGEAWKQEYFNVPAKNNGYTTWSVAVPISVVRSAVSQAAMIDVSNELMGWNTP